MMLSLFYIFFFNDTATTEIYTLSLHDALPIFAGELLEHELELVDDRRGQSGGVESEHQRLGADDAGRRRVVGGDDVLLDRKSTRLNSSHANISYAVFCLKKKK